MTATESLPPSRKLLQSKFFWIGVLYFAEGFPLGVFYDVLPVYFRQQGVDLREIGLMSLLGLAWTLKFLWAPAVDHFRHHRLWMISADWLMAAVMLWFAVHGEFGSWVWFAVGLFTLLSATNDIAIDGYTIEMLDYMEKVRPGTGREAGLGHAGGRAPEQALEAPKAGPWRGRREQLPSRLFPSPTDS